MISVWDPLSSFQISNAPPYKSHRQRTHVVAHKTLLPSTQYSHQTSPDHLPVSSTATRQTTNDMVGAMPAAEALPREVTANGYGGGAKHLQLQLQLPAPQPKQQQPAEPECKWYEEEIDDDLKLCYALNR